MGFTCPDPLAPSNVNLSSVAAGSAAERAETRKGTKYADLVSSGDYSFVPIAIETLGAWGPSAAVICTEIGGRVRAHTGEVRSVAFLRQRLSIAVQRGNAASVLGTVPRVDWLPV